MTTGSRSTMAGVVKSHRSRRSTTLTSLPAALRRTAVSSGASSATKAIRACAARASSSGMGMPPARSIRRRLASAASVVPIRMTGWPSSFTKRGRLCMGNSLPVRVARSRDTLAQRCSTSLEVNGEGVSIPQEIRHALGGDQRLGQHALGDHGELVAIDHHLGHQRARIVGAGHGRAISAGGAEDGEVAALHDINVAVDGEGVAALADGTRDIGDHAFAGRRDPPRNRATHRTWRGGRDRSSPRRRSHKAARHPASPR